MKIGPHESKPAPAPAADRKAAPATGKSTAEPSAQVELSSAATALSGASSSSADPTFDASKVDRIAQSIRDGKFKINAEAIADKLIINAAELLGRKAN